MHYDNIKQFYEDDGFIELFCLALNKNTDIPNKNNNISISGSDINVGWRELQRVRKLRRSTPFQYEENELPILITASNFDACYDEQIGFFDSPIGCYKNQERPAISFSSFSVVWLIQEYSYEIKLGRTIKNYNCGEHIKTEKIKVSERYFDQIVSYTRYNTVSKLTELSVYLDKNDTISIGSCTLFGSTLSNYEIIEKALKKRNIEINWLNPLNLFGTLENEFLAMSILNNI